MDINAKRAVVKVLQRCEVFLGLSDDELDEISSLPSIAISSIEPGQVLSKQGKPAQYFYILVDGKIELRMNVNFDLDTSREEITVDTVTKGSVFSWSALVRPYISSRTSICVEGGQVLAIRGRELMALMDGNEHIGYEAMKNIASVISSRLRAPNTHFWAEVLRRRSSA